MTDKEEYTIQPEKYEVVRLTNGSEFACMTIDKGDRLLAILPMIAHLTNTGNGTTSVTFQPYNILSSDINIVITKEHILHRSDLHIQFIPIYDEASSKWMEMIEENEIPLANDMMDIEIIPEEDVEYSEDFSERLDEYLDEMMEETPTDTKKIH